MPDGVWKGVQVFGHSKQLSLNKFFDPSTPSMRKGRDGGKMGKKRVKKRKKTNENSGHYIVCQQSTARTTTAATPHTFANKVVN